jgi:outer membrane receptor protein involved in Fe transport
MKHYHKITHAILTALSAQAGLAYAANEAADTGYTSDTLEEITVTATRRSESVQNVPITIQALTGEQLQQDNVTSFEDVAKYLPNVSFGANNPGGGEIYMRGLSAGPAAGEQSSASILPFPNVAVYLDDQSVQFPGRNLDVYMADMNRIEVLEGPQGTTFGGGAEAGAVRYITNKPDLKTEGGNVSAMYGITTHGDPNQSIQAVLNLPIIDGVFALRGVIYDERRGGYIDNLPSTFTLSPTDPGWFGPLQSQVIGNNYGLAGNAQNPTTYGGIRVEALWQVNDDWSALLTQSFQNMEADGSSAQYVYGSDYNVNPTAPQVLGPWQGTFFSPAWDKDKFENTALTINGKVGPLSLVYSGAYLIRHVDQAADYTNYARSVSGYYYDCTGPATQNPSNYVQCYSPVMPWRDQTRNAHLSNELRLSTPDDWRFRGLFGLYQEDFNIADNMNFQYNNLPGCNTAADIATAEANNAADAPGGVCVGSIGPVPGPSAVDPSPRSSVVNYGEDERRGYSQYAAFTSLDFDIIPKVLTITGGTRYYHYNEYEFGTRYLGNCTDAITCTPIYGAGNIIDPTSPNPGGVNGGGSYPNYQAPYYPFGTNYHGFRSRGNLTWHITPDVMAYYTFSQGFRPGGFNRFSRLHFGKVPECANGDTPVSGPAATACGGTPATSGPYQFQDPYSYAPDTVTNNEVGLKSEWFEHRLQLNASVYQMDWKNAQFIFFDPTDGFGSSNFVINGPNYRIQGVELQILAKPVPGLTLRASGSYNDSKQQNAVCLLVNNLALATAGQCITQTIKGASVNAITSPLGEPGTPTAFSPKLQYSAQARYDWNLVSDYRAFFSVGTSYTGSMYNQPAGYPTPGVGSTPLYPATSVRERFFQPSYSTYDASVGVMRNLWTVTFFGQNLGNSDASTYTNTAQYTEQEVPLRPRVLGLRVDKKF